MSLVHLSGIVLFGFVLTFWLWPGVAVADPGTGRRFAKAASVTAIVTGSVLVVTLVSSSALGLKVSLQYLQALSAIDIAWVVAATTFGLRWRFGTAAGFAGGVAIAVVCVWSIWRYLDTVGFTDAGGWLVDADVLNRLVFPIDMAAAVVAIGLLWWGSAQPTEQRSPQS